MTWNESQSLCYIKPYWFFFSNPTQTYTHTPKYSKMLTFLSSTHLFRWACLALNRLLSSVHRLITLISVSLSIPLSFPFFLISLGISLWLFCFSTQLSCVKSIFFPRKKKTRRKCVIESKFMLMSFRTILSMRTIWSSWGTYLTTYPLYEESLEWNASLKSKSRMRNDRGIKSRTHSPTHARTRLYNPETP